MTKRLADAIIWFIIGFATAMMIGLAFGAEAKADWDWEWRDRPTLKQRMIDAIIPESRSSSSSRQPRIPRRMRDRDTSIKPARVSRGRLARLECGYYRAHYVSEHPARKPRSLRRLRGCRLWRADYDFHRGVRWSVTVIVPSINEES